MTMSVDSNGNLIVNGVNVTSGMNQLRQTIDENISEDETDYDALTNEINRATLAENAIASDLSDEISRAQSAENTLAGSISAMQGKWIRLSLTSGDQTIGQSDTTIAITPMTGGDPNNWYIGSHKVTLPAGTYMCFASVTLYPVSQSITGQCNMQVRSDSGLSHMIIIHELPHEDALSLSGSCLITVSGTVEQRTVSMSAYSSAISQTVKSWTNGTYLHIVKVA